MTDRVIGQILVSRGLVLPEQLEEALVTQSKNSETGLIEILDNQGIINEKAAYQEVAKELGFPYREVLNPDEVDLDLVRNLKVDYLKTHGLLPIMRNAQGTAFTIATSNPFDPFPMDDLRLLLNAKPEPVVVPPSSLLNAINGVFNKIGGMISISDVASKSNSDSLEDTIVDIIDATDEGPIIKLVNSTLHQAVKDRASDIHFEPSEEYFAIRFRVDGVLREIVQAPKQLQAPILSRLKIMAGMNIAEKRLPQDGRIRVKIAGRDIDIRASTIPTSHGERAVLRLLERASILLDLEDLGFCQEHLTIMDKVIRKPHGILLVTGPTGSGKTTTLYACLSRINSPDKNILTVEDPVEYQLPGISQMQVNPKINLTFATGLRHFLRQDPDVIMVGEIRDVETAEIAIQASLTGHLVFSTIHTNDAAGAFTRLTDMGVESFLVSSTLVMAMAQRLIRVLCKKCREPYIPEDLELLDLGLDPTTVRSQLAENPIYRAKGCEACLHTGYKGRSGIYELLLINDEIRSLVMQGCDAGTLKKAAMAAGMETLRTDGAKKILNGVTSIEEVLRVTQEDNS